MDISYKIGNGKFNYRVAGVLIHDNKVLLDTEEGFDFWNLPGGRVKMFESTTQALQREIFEELGTKPTIERLLWVTENLFNMSSWGNIHELCFYYLISFPKASEIYQKQTFVIQEVVEGKARMLSFKWVDIAALKTLNIKPEFLKNGIQALPSYPEHIVINELEILEY